MLLATSKNATREPETLRRHREMYENRLRHIRITQGRSEKEVVDKSNNPKVFRKAAEALDELTPAPPQK